MEINKAFIKKINKIGIGFIENSNNEKIIFFNDEKINNNSINSIDEGGFILFSDYGVSIQDNNSYSVVTIPLSEFEECKYSFDLEYDVGKFNFNLKSSYEEEADEFEFTTVQCEGDNKNLFLKNFESSNSFYIEMVRFLNSIIVEMITNRNKMLLKSKRNMF